MTFRDLTTFFSFFDTRKSCVFRYCYEGLLKLICSPNVINFDCVGFSERRPEEVISFLWRSMYLYNTLVSYSKPHWKYLLHDDENYRSYLLCLRCRHVGYSFLLRCRPPHRSRRWPGRSWRPGPSGVAMSRENPGGVFCPTARKKREIWFNLVLYDNDRWLFFVFVFISEQSWKSDVYIYINPCYMTIS